MKSSFDPVVTAPANQLSKFEVAQWSGHGVENAWARLEVDLDAQLFFQHQALVLTASELILQTAGAEGEQTLGHWPLRPGLRLQHSDHAGAGSLELFDEQGRLAQ